MFAIGEIQAGTASAAGPARQFRTHRPDALRVQRAGARLRYEIPRHLLYGQGQKPGTSGFPRPGESAQIRRMIKFVSVGCVVGLLAFAGCSTTPKRLTAEELFKKADVSGDGRVSRKEYEDFMIVDMFAIYDANGDGYITEAEFVADGGTASTFRELNVSGTGKLTKDEAMNSAFIRNR